MSFDISRVQKYLSSRYATENKDDVEAAKTTEQIAKYDCEQMPATNFNLKAVFSIFDTNYDGKISKEEFEKVNCEEYNQYV